MISQHTIQITVKSLKTHTILAKVNFKVLKVLHNMVPYLGPEIMTEYFKGKDKDLIFYVDSVIKSYVEEAQERRKNHERE